MDYPIGRDLEMILMPIITGGKAIHQRRINAALRLCSGLSLDTSKVLDARRRREERSKATPPFDFAQGREPVERQLTS